MATLYVVEPGARLEKEYQRLLVTLDDEVLLRVPIQHVTQVVLVGRVGATTPALHSLLQHEVNLLLVSRTGRLLGRLLPPTCANLPLRQAQYRRNDDPVFSLGMARAIVAGKVRNQRVLVQRLARRRKLACRQQLDALKQAVSRARTAPDLDTVLGIEGQAARLYFHLYRKCFSPAWDFTKRTRRPPKDPVNALLSLGYTFLGYAMMAALEAVGLDPYLGYFHAEKYGRPALALDLVEEFRAPVVDSLVLTLINQRTFEPDDFSQSDEHGVRLSANGMRVFCYKFSQKLESTFKSRRIGRALSYRKLFEVQARKLADAIRSEGAPYEPFQYR